MNRSQYEEIKAAEWDYAVKRMEGIRNCKDPLVRYREGRPIIDIKHMLMTSAEIYADRPAFYDKDKPGGEYRAITYRQTLDEVNALGTALLNLGLKGKHIGVIGENCYQWALSYLAVVCGVGVVVPLDKELPAEELENLCRESDMAAIIYTSKYRGMFHDMRWLGNVPMELYICTEASAESEELNLPALLELGRQKLAAGDTSYADVIIERDKMGMLLFTSGTTGISKGVMLSHGNIAEELMASPTLLQVKPSDIFFSILPLHHTYECTCSFLQPLYCGASIAYCEGLRHIPKNLAEIKPTMLLCVPLILESMYKKIWQQVRKSGMEKKLRKLLKINRISRKVGLNLVPKKITDVFGGRMRTIIVGGAAIDPDVLRGVQDFNITAVQGYGLTECGPICAMNPDVGFKDEAAGYAPPGFDLKIHQPDPETGIGEICARGGNIMLGYYKNPEATAEALQDGWFHTGDLGYLDDDRFVYITGRKKNVIITKNGKNVYPEELEYYLDRSPYVQEVMVWGKDSEGTGETLIYASILPNAEEVAQALGENYSEEQVYDLISAEVDRINENLPLFKKIKKIDIRKTEFDKTTTKKIKRYKEANKISG